MKVSERCARVLGLLLLAWLGPMPPAVAELRSTVADAGIHFRRGAEAYQAGQFEAAIIAFEAAYQLAPEPVLLFNIAQANRRLGRKERALFLYRRYLEQTPESDPNRADAARHVTELVREAQQEEEQRRVVAPAPSRESSGASMRRSIDDEPEGAMRSPLYPWTIAVRAGLALMRFGNDDVEAPAAMAGALDASRVWQRGRLNFQLGLEGVVVPLTFTRLDGHSEGRSWMVGGLLSPGLSIEVAPRWQLGGALGVGVLWWGGLDRGNPFTSMGRAATAPVPLPSVALRAELRYLPGDRVFLVAGPSLTASKATSEGLTNEVPLVTRWELGLGLGFTL